MLQRRLSIMGGVMKPGEISIAQSVFDEYCQMHAIDRNSTDAEDIAARILMTYKSGQTLQDLRRAFFLL